MFERSQRVIRNIFPYVSHTTRRNFSGRGLEERVEDAGVMAAACFAGGSVLGMACTHSGVDRPTPTDYGVNALIFGMLGGASGAVFAFTPVGVTIGLPVGLIIYGEYTDRSNSR